MNDKHLISLSAKKVFDAQYRHARRAEQLAEARIRYEKKHPRRKHGKTGSSHSDYMERPFIAWDGEGPKDTGYSLFGWRDGKGNSGDVCYPGPLRTRDCLDLLVDVERRFPDAIHILFGGNYDVSNILWELPRRKFLQLAMGRSAHWEGYILRHVPGKWFDVKHGKVTVRVYDIRSFFEGGLVQVLEEWEIGPFAESAETEFAKDGNFDPTSVSIPTVSQMNTLTESQIVRVFKGLRSEFYFKDIASIRIYMNLELKYTILLMERVRYVLYQAGFTLQSWHGPGAIATKAMSRHHVFKAMAETPKQVHEAALYAMFGGRFEDRLGGHAQGPIWVADLNSAYPYFATMLPNLARGTWREGRNFEPGKFAVYHIKYDEPLPSRKSYKPYFERLSPLPRRMKDGSIHFPPHVEGWYWAPEAELVKDDPNAEFIDSWVFDEEDENDRPFAFLKEMYRLKQSAKERGDRVGWVWKKIINAIFGQTAKKSGWQRSRHAPRSHQIEWAGYITSACRSAIYRAAKRDESGIVSLDTDGITSLHPIVGLDFGGALGQWSLKEYDDGVFWQSGLYYLRKGDEWHKAEAKTRGIPRGTYTAEDLLLELSKLPWHHEDRSLKLCKRQFITYRTAMLGRWKELNTWVDEPMRFLFGGQGKRFHTMRRCDKHCSELQGDMHYLSKPFMYHTNFGDTWSLPHRLPWENFEEPIGDISRDEYVVDANNLEDDMIWVRWEE